MAKIFALIDCNNFFVSCERIFQPKLQNSPVVVLSSNDGCAVSRSNEAKMLGIKMGEPYFKFKELSIQNNVTVLSSNFHLYRDISNRVMRILAQMANNVEFYSVDEAFLDLSHLDENSLIDYGAHIRKTILQWVGIPVSVGIASTKTLSKVAAHYAKKSPVGVVYLSLPQVENALRHIPVSEVWGVGKSANKLMTRYGIRSALDLRSKGIIWAKKYMSVHGGRLIQELNGFCAYEIGNSEDSRKSITVSRSFASPTSDKNEVKMAVCEFAEKACKKLREFELHASSMNIFVASNRFKEDYYANSYLINLPIASDYTPDFLAMVDGAMPHLFKYNVEYKKIGVTLSDLTPKLNQQLSLLNNSKDPKYDQLSKSIDSINKRYGDKSISFASAGVARNGKNYNKQFLSPRFTTNWDDLPIVK